MENIIKGNIYQENMNEDEFQFYKDELKNNVKQYLEIDDQIKALNKALTERRKQKTKLAEDILGTMKKFEIDNMNTKNGRLVYSVSKNTPSLNKKNLLSGLNIYFNDMDKASEASTIVLKNRPTVEKVKLKRIVSKNNSPI